VLIIVSFLAGIIAGISPCILPVLPVVFFTGATGELDEPDSQPRRQSWRRPVAIALGLVASFTVLVLAGAELLSLFHLPDGFLRDLGIALLALIGLGLLIPSLGNLLERPFARLSAHQNHRAASGFVVGLALGLVFVPCAGPVLATITVLGATHDVGFETVIVALCFGAGVAVPLLFIAFAGDRLVARSKRLRANAPLLRLITGVIMLVIALGVALNLFDGLQRAVPGYTSALQNSIEGSSSVRQALNSLNSSPSTNLASCPASASQLVDCGPAPAFTDITAWLNTPGNRPLTMKGLRGSVVLIDFWTYSCINCQRSLPHVEAWYSHYSKDGFVVVGIHAPEFSFEHVVANVKTAAHQLGVQYPIAIDNNFGTWNAYSNEYWPAEYLVDAKGNVRHVDFGEGGYATTEALIRQLLLQAHPGIALPPQTNTPTKALSSTTNPETYLGAERQQNLASPQTPTGSPQVFTFPATLAFPQFALKGTWTIAPQFARAGANAGLELSYQASDVYLVMGGSGTVTVNEGNGTPPRVINVSGIPRLYQLLGSANQVSGTMQLTFSPGIEAYDLTFG
jgi:cytochrome c biogenesis protein CcdA/thiol-disulfide isomerase/thioredoxin